MGGCLLFGVAGAKGELGQCVGGGAVSSMLRVKLGRVCVRMFSFFIYYFSNKSH